MSQDRLLERAPGATPARGTTTWITLLALLSAGWATNHFAAMLPVLAEVAHISKPGLDAAFGLYALGLLPSLLLGGGLSDRHGRRPVMVTGLTLAALGNLVMLAWSTLPGITVGRLVVGLGVGMVASAGTAWAADQDETKGAARAGVLLTSGFAVGPVATALIAWVAPERAGAHLAFAVPVLLTGVCALLCLRVPDRGPAGAAARRATAGDTPPTLVTEERRLGPALAASLPMALWVFACVTISMIVLTERIDEQYAGPLLPAVAAVLSLGTGVLAQVGMRRVGGWRGLGVVGAALATTGYVSAGAAGAQVGLATFVVCSVILGCAYGLCLGQGLRDVERLAPLASRGVATGLFYVVSYSGFALPFVLNTYEDRLGASAPMYVLAALAAITALARLRQMRQGGAPRPAPQ
ncbi:MFS transporter [Janibacter indicus]|uniref:MFS transporter n=1 Tax=Janibacter indicus TaxID=857417 RepID=A0A7L9J308_9MICO|nr:MFS transporter [Janibacter indicus]QOK23996.1 MFS transporter [Janibacter indicus]